MKIFEKDCFQDVAGDMKGGQAKPRTKTEPRVANQILLPPPKKLLTEKPGVLCCDAFSAQLAARPSVQFRNKHCALSFQECSDHVSMSLASYLCMANSACTDEVTHQKGFTLYVFSQTYVSPTFISCHVCYYAQTVNDILYVCQPDNEASFSGPTWTS